MTKRKKSETKYPLLIYAIAEHEDTSYMIATSDPAGTGVSNGTEVAIYKFVRTAKVRIKTEVV